MYADKIKKKIGACHFPNVSFVLQWFISANSSCLEIPQLLPQLWQWLRAGWASTCLSRPILSQNACFHYLQTKCKTVKFIQAGNTNLPLSDQDSQQFIILMYALCLSIKTYLQGFNLLWYDVLNKVTQLREQDLLQLSPQLTRSILILKIIYWKWPVTVSPIQWQGRGDWNLMVQLQNQNKGHRVTFQYWACFHWCSL